jgi:hypothetical protein
MRDRLGKLSEERLVHDYQTFYYAAQRLYAEKDNQKENADIIFVNQ